MLKRLWALRSSMVVQFAVLAAIVLGVMIYVFVVLRLIDVYNRVEESTVDEQSVQAILFEFSRIQYSGLTAEDSEFLNRVRDSNPKLRYFVSGSLEGEPFTLQYGGEPQWRDKVKALQDARQAAAPPGLETCDTVTLENPQGSDQVYIYSRQCGEESYYSEVTGIENPIVADPDRVGLTQILWESNREWIIQAVILLTTVGAIFLIHIRSLRRLARIANSFDPKALDYALPTERLPTEVVPLIEAVNNLIHKVGEAQKRERFFLSAAAHEMRTPLAALRTRLALLPEGEAREELENDLKRIIRLVDQLLRLMRLRGRLEYLDRVDLVARCSKSIEALRPLASAKQVDVILESECREFPVWGNGDLVEVAMSNMIDNAISFTPPGDKVIVHISRDGRVTVRDFGPGLSKTLAGSVFQPFAKFPPNREGHGLGLAIVKAIADLHGAEAGAAPAEEKGAVFFLHFPGAADLD